MSKFAAFRAGTTTIGDMLRPFLLLTISRTMKTAAEREVFCAHKLIEKF
jgi:hypothetical protein